MTHATFFLATGGEQNQAAAFIWLDAAVGLGPEESVIFPNRLPRALGIKYSSLEPCVGHVPCAYQ